jgi:flagellin-like protein
MLFRGKRAMSPLIATVLLIAFAVALGAMIMNWSSGVSASDRVEAANCEGVAINLEEAMCLQDSQVTVQVRNTGDARIDALEIVFINEAEDLDLRLRIPDSSLIKSEAMERIVKTITNSLDTQVELNPLVLNADGELVACEPAGLIQDRLVSC